VDNASSKMHAIVSVELASFVASFLVSFSFLIQQYFLRCPDFLQYQHINLLFLPLDFDLDVPLEFQSFSFDQPLTTNVSDVEISRLYFYRVSSNNRAPMIASKSMVSIDIKLIKFRK